MSRPRENETLRRHLRLGLGLLILAASATGWRPSASPAGRALAQGQPAPPAIYLPLVLRSQSGFVPARTALPATATPAPSATLEPSPTPSQTPSPSATPEPSPTPTKALPEWQARVNLHRALARLAPVDANADWSRGGELHARYMVKNDLFGHSEQRGNAWFTEEGLAAAQSGNVTISTDIDQPAADAAQFDSESLWAQVAPQVRPGTRVLVVRGADAAGEGAGRDWLRRQIEAAGGSVDHVQAYRRVAPAPQAEALALARAALQDGSLWLLSSSEAVANLRGWLPDADFSRARALASHPRIAEVARAAGFGHVDGCRPPLEDVVRSIKSRP